MDNHGTGSLHMYPTPTTRRKIQKQMRMMRKIMSNGMMIHRRRLVGTQVEQERKGV
jgi:hypothetical protein